MTTAISPSRATGRVTFASRLGFGGSGLGTLYRDVSEEQADRTLAAAYDSGLRYFDTAPLYGHGLSELRIGRFIRSVSRATVTVSTKVGRYMIPPRGQPVDYGLWAAALRLKPVFDYSYDGTMRSLEQSANRLGFEDFDIVYIHDVDRYTFGDDFRRRYDEAMEGSYRALDDLRKMGHVKAIGVGVNESDVATRFLEAGRFDAVMIAGRYTLLDRSAAGDLLRRAEEDGIDVVAAGVFNSGILASADVRATYDYAPASDDIIARTRRLTELCARHGVPVQAAAIQFPFNHPAVSAVVLGMARPETVRQNVEWAKIPIPVELWEDLLHVG